MLSQPININPDSEGTLLDTLLRTALEVHATDIHIPNNGLCYMRRSNLLQPVVNENTGEHISISEQSFEKVLAALQISRTETYSKKQLWGDPPYIQLRALYLNVPQYNNKHKEEVVILRTQQLRPPDLSDIIDSKPVLDALEDPHGLILVVGMIGSGKTSLASSICAEWAKQGKHIFTVEDPVEYNIAGDTGRVTQLGASMSSAGNNNFSFEQAANLALRADIDGLFIGESRRAETFRVVLDAATTHEPCITTLHAGGFADALVRSLAFAQDSMNPDIARFTLSQALHSILHVTLTYTETGAPIPMVAVLPFHSSDHIRKLFLDFSPINLLDRIKEVLNDNAVKEKITYDEASESARRRGATEESIAAARAFNSELPSYLQ